MSDAEDGGPGRREVAYRLFAAEFDDADLAYSESDEERAPNYVVTPTGARVNRLFVVGVLTEVESVSEGVLRARVVDPTGAFVCYAGQYQPDERAFLERAEPPTFVAVTGKARTFQPDDADTVYTSVRPESINEVDAETRDRWTLQAAEQTVDRVRLAAAALSGDRRGDDLAALLRANGVPEGPADGIPLALEHYGTSPAYLAGLYDTAVEAARLVAGEIDEVPRFDRAPDAGGEADLASLSPASLETEPADAAEAAPADEPAGDDTAAAEAGPGEAAADDPESASEAVEAGGNPAESGGEAVEAAGGPAAEGTEDAAAPDLEATGDEAAEATGPEADGATEADDLGDFEGEAEFDLDADEREEIEAEYGTEFQSGTEVEDPGAADLDTPGPADAEAEPGAAGESTEDGPQPSEAGEEAAAGADAAGGADGGEAAAESDLEDLVVEVMEDLDEGGGADRGAVLETAVERSGAGEAAVEDAIQDALMDGRCYEPDDTTLQPI